MRNMEIEFCSIFVKLRNANRTDARQWIIRDNWTIRNTEINWWLIPLTAIGITNWNYFGIEEIVKLLLLLLLAIIICIDFELNVRISSPRRTLDSGSHRKRWNCFFSIRFYWSFDFVIDHSSISYYQQWRRDVIDHLPLIPQLFFSILFEHIK